VAPKGSDEGLKALSGKSRNYAEIAARPLIRLLRRRLLPQGEKERSADRGLVLFGVRRVDRRLQRLEKPAGFDGLGDVVVHTGG
jgi:hypothetical protein